MGPSTLHRLFRYASAPQNDALENFTTEALAGAIRHDATPMLTVLREAGVLSSEATIEATLTQVTVRGVGIIDLELHVRAEGACIVWIEVKVNAGESGDQLDRYIRYASERPELDIRLVTLARGPVRPTVRAMTWRSLRAASRSSTSPFWTDLGLFLEEIAMADDHDTPFTSVDAASLGPALALVRKAERLVTAVAIHANASFPAWNWPTDTNEVRKQLAAQFVNHGRYVIVNRLVVPAWCFFGIVPGADGAQLCVVLEARPKATEVRRRLLAATADLPTHWERVPAGWPLLRARVPLLEHAQHDAAVEWSRDRIDELACAGVFELSVRLRADAPDDGVDEGEGS